MRKGCCSGQREWLLVPCLKQKTLAPPKHFQSRTPVPGATEIKPTFHYLVVTPATKVLDSSRHF